MQLQADQVYAQLGTIIFGAVDAYGVDWSLESLEGWAGTPRNNFAPISKTRSPGAWAGDSNDGARTIALGGKVFAPNAQALQAAIDRLDGVVTNSAASLAVVEAGFVRYATVRKSDEVLVNWLMPTIAEWSVQVTALDPRKLGTALTQATALPSSSGGKTWPDTWPQTWPAVSITGQIALTNPGNATGPVRLRVDGPVTGPVITHRGATEKTIAFASSLTLGAGEWLTVDMDARTALANDQAPRSQYITSRGWSGFDSGANVWAFSAAAYSSGALLTVTATPAWN